VTITFYISRNFELQTDGLIGLPDLVAHDIVIRPKFKLVQFKNKNIQAQEIPTPYLRSQNIGFIQNLENNNNSPFIKAITAQNIVLNPHYIHKVKVKITLPRCVQPHNGVLSLIETVKVKNLGLESTLNNVDNDNYTDIYLFNKTNTDIHLRKGTYVCDLYQWTETEQDNQEKNSTVLNVPQQQDQNHEKNGELRQN
jgi:hypothetical protein